MSVKQSGSPLAFQLAVAALALFVGDSAGAQPIRGEVPQTVGDSFLSEVPGVTVETWIENLQIPWSLIFLPNGDALVAERPGTIRRIPSGANQAELYAEIDVVHASDNGLLGIAIHPDFENQPYLYAMHGYYHRPDSLRNRVVRLKHEGVSGRFDRVIFDGIPGDPIHIGGRIAFGPDGMLYIGTGDLWNQQVSQDLTSWAGKILRITSEGEIPTDNPFPGSPVYSYGHRVVQGLAWDPDTGAMFNSEHGPSGEWPGVDQRDEINRVERGGNCGWAKVVGAPRLEGYVDPIVMWRGASVPPAGMTFFRGDLFVATLRSQALVRIRFEETEADYRVRSIERWFAQDRDSGTYGRLRDVVAGPDGHLYVTTSNTDGRAKLRPNDDKILRLKFESPLPTD